MGGTFYLSSTGGFIDPVESGACPLGANDVATIQEQHVKMNRCCTKEDMHCYGLVDASIRYAVNNEVSFAVGSRTGAVIH